MELTQKVKIEPTEEQEDVLTSLSEMCRLLYNFSLKERNENWKENADKPEGEREYISYTDQQNKLPDLKKRCPRYKWVYSKVLQMTLRKLDADFKSFFALRRNGDERARPPKYKGKKHFTTLCYNQSGFKIEGNRITLSHNHPHGTPLTFEISEKFNFDGEDVRQVEISRDELKREYHASVTYREKTPEYRDNGLYQAFDLGIIKHTGVNMRGKFVEFVNPRPDKYWEPKVRKVQSKRDRCKKGSRRWEWYHRKLQMMKRKCSYQLKDRQHKLSRVIVNNTRANTIVIGRLGVKRMASQDCGNKKGLNRSLQNTGFLGRFARFLAYKAKLVGKKTIEISEKNTTRDCCLCGKREDRPPWERTIRCDCGNVIDRDKNSAVNIMMRFLSQERSVDEQSSFMEGFLRQTGLGYAHKLTPTHSQEAPCESKG